MSAEFSPVLRGAHVSEPAAGDRLAVYYDGECPVCRIEVAFYRRLDRAGRIDWRDVWALADDRMPVGKSRDDLLRVFHVIDRGGHWVVGVDAFAAIWRELPVFRRFWWLFKIPLIRQAAQAAYRLFLAWQRRDRARREAREPS